MIRYYRNIKTGLKKPLHKTSGFFVCQVYGIVIEYFDLGNQVFKEGIVRQFQVNSEDNDRFSSTHFELSGVLGSATDLDILRAVVEDAKHRGMTAFVFDVTDLQKISADACDFLVKFANERLDAGGVVILFGLHQEVLQQLGFMCEGHISKLLATFQIVANEGQAQARLEERRRKSREGTVSIDLDG